MPISQLAALIPPPESPLDSEGNWDAVGIIVDVDYPPDFREMIGRYGSGAFLQGHLTVFNPLTLEGLARIKQAERTCRRHRESDTLPLAVHPDKPGLLPWGRDENGNTYCWLTKGKPEKWPIVYLGHGYESHPVKLRTDVTGFLAGYSTDEFESLAQADDPTTESMRIFTPGRSQAEVARRLLDSREE